MVVKSNQVGSAAVDIDSDDTGEENTLVVPSNSENSASKEKAPVKLHFIRGYKNELRPLSQRKKIYLILKALFDFASASIMLVFSLPLMLLTYISIKIVSPGPAILKQQRLTLNDRQFTIYKFRTMRVDAEKLSGAKMAEKDDPRIFPLGKFLRKSRLDELPQLINVLKGEMSIVGPRPERPEIAKNLAKELHGFDRRTNAKAGLTGLAQVEHGYCSSVDSYKKKLALDLLYLRKQSLLLDVFIMFRTVFVVLFFRGAR